MPNDLTQSSTSTILVVDDEPRNISLIKNLCESLGYKVITATNGREGVEAATNGLPDLILMDVMMPELNGFDATWQIKKNDLTKHIPVIIVTALDSRDERINGIEKGANDFLTKPLDLKELSLRVKNNLDVKKYHDMLKNYSKVLEERVAEKTLELKQSYEKNKASYIEAIYRLNLAAEYKDEDTGSHIRRISLFAKEVSLQMGMDNAFCDTIYYASPMHDIGKVGVPDAILTKPGKLTDDEFRTIQSHTTIGAKILSGSDSDFLKMAEEIALTHHEKWSGFGYPNKLKGEEIPISGRITNIVDQYDALRSQRPYKPAFDHQKTFSIITEGDGRTSPDDFDPQVLDAFKKASKRLDEIFNSVQD